MAWASYIQNTEIIHTRSGNVFWEVALLTRLAAREMTAACNWFELAIGCNRMQQLATGCNSLQQAAWNIFQRFFVTMCNIFELSPSYLSIRTESFPSSSEITDQESGHGVWTRSPCQTDRTTESRTKITNHGPDQFTSYHEPNQIISYQNLVLIRTNKIIWFGTIIHACQQNCCHQYRCHDFSSITILILK